MLKELEVAEGGCVQKTQVQICRGYHPVGTADGQPLGDGSEACAYIETPPVGCRAECVEPAKGSWVEFLGKSGKSRVLVLAVMSVNFFTVGVMPCYHLCTFQLAPRVSRIDSVADRGGFAPVIII